MCKRCHRALDKSAITHCPSDHEYTPDNTLMDVGKRKCKTCVYAKNREYNRNLSPAQRARKVELQRQRRAKARSAA
jgi:hypothetical protein